MSSGHKRIIQRLHTGLGSQVFYQMVNLFIRLAEVPLFLTFWGGERYGEWLMISAIPAYLAMADGGFTGTTQREMTMRMGANDRQGALITFQSTWVLLLLVSAVAMAAVFIITALLPIAQWLNLKSMAGDTLAVVIFLLSIHIIVGFQCSLIYGGYSCVGRYGRGTFLTALTYLLDFGGLAFVIILGGGAIQASLGFLAGRLIGLAIFVFDLPKVAPWLHFGWKSASKAQVIKLLRPSLTSMAFPLGEALNNQGMRLVVGLVLGPTAVTVFSSIRTLCRSTMKPVTIIARLIEPEMSLAYGAARPDLVRDLFNRSSQITLWTALPACVGLWLTGGFVLNFWTQGQIPLDVPLYTLLLLASAANCLWFTALMVPYATNKHQGVALLYVGVQVIALFLTVFFTDQFGISGAGLALVSIEITLIIGVLKQALQLSGETLNGWIRVIVSPPSFLFTSEHPHHSLWKGRR